jgi:hypothetical protein
MKATPAQIERWNQQAQQDARAYDLPQIWIVVTPTEFQALMDGIVGSALQVRLTQSRLNQEPFQEPPV